MNATKGKTHMKTHIDTTNIPGKTALSSGTQGKKAPAQQDADDPAYHGCWNSHEPVHGATMLRLNAVGTSKEVWIDARTLDLALCPGRYRHPQFKGAMRDKIRHLATTFYAVYPKTYRAWEKGLRMSENPWTEIAPWVQIADALCAFKTEFRPTSEQQLEAFHLLCAAMNANTIDVVPRILATHLTGEMANRLYRLFGKPAAMR